MLPTCQESEKKKDKAKKERCMFKTACAAEKLFGSQTFRHHKVI